MPHYPGRSRRLFEAQLPDLTVRAVAPPDGSRLAPRYRSAAFAAAYEVGIASWSTAGIDDVLAAFPALLPDSLASLARGSLLGLLLCRSAPPPPKAVQLAPDEAVLALTGGAIDVLISLRLGDDRARRWLTVTTLARPRLRLGRLLLPWFVGRHTVRMPVAVADLAKRIDTPRPRPPWSAALSGPTAGGR